MVNGQSDSRVDDSLKLTMAKRVVITGMGIWSCLGNDIETVRQSLFEGKSGIGLKPERLEYGYRSGLTGLVETPVITKQMLDRHTRAGMSEEAQYAYMASRQAFALAGFDDAYLRQHEVGCIFGNDSSAKPVIEASRIMDQKHDSAMLGYGLVFQSMNSTVNMNLSTIFHLRGVNFTVSAACASGSHSIGLAYMLIRQGLQDTILCGGAQETNYYSMATFDALGAFSVRMNAPRPVVPLTRIATDSYPAEALQRWYSKTTSTPWPEVPPYWPRLWVMVFRATVVASLNPATAVLSLP